MTNQNTSTINFRDYVPGLLSVIIPVKNREKWIQEALESVWEQTYRPIEVIVVDNGSDDKSFRMAEQWRRGHATDGFDVILAESTTPGASSTRNKGLMLSHGEFIFFLDSDDRMEPDLSELAVRRLTDSPESSLVTWHRRIVGGCHNGHINHAPGPHPLECQIVHCCLSTQTIMVRRPLLQKTGIWNEELPVWNDLEFGFRLLLTGTKPIVIDKVLCSTFWHTDSLTGRGFGTRAGLWEKSLESISSLISRNPMLSHLSVVVDYRGAVLAGHYRKEKLKRVADLLLQKTLRRHNRWNRLTLRAVALYVATGAPGAWLWASRLLKRDSIDGDVSPT